MNYENVVKKRRFELAVRGVNFYKWFVSEKKGFIMSKQFLRSVASVGANVRETLNAQRNPDFIHKLSIAQKECDESMFWLELLKETDYISKTGFDSIHKQCNEVLKNFGSIIITSKKKLITHN